MQKLRSVKIGVFDSGLGGLFVLKALKAKLPQYDYAYLGDTKRVPYGNRSSRVVAEFLEEGVEFLFKKGCALIIVACNTASADALRNIQQNYLPGHYPNRRVLGVIIPTAEEVLRGDARRIGVLATQGTVNSGAYIREIKKINPRVKIFQEPAPLLVPLVESDAIYFSKPILEAYLAPLLRKRVDAIILGCTHYAILKNKIRKLAGVKIISQDEFMPKKLAEYLARHPEIESTLGKNRRINFYVTDITPATQESAKKWFGKSVALKKINL